MRKWIEWVLKVTFLTLAILTIMVGGTDWIDLNTLMPPHSANLEKLGQDFQEKWDEDVELLIQENQKILETVGQVKVINRSEKVKPWSKYLIAPFTEISGQKNLLEIIIITWEDGAIFAAVFEYTVYNPLTNELLWETTRTVYIRGSEEEFESLHETNMSNTNQ
ncbi:MAG: hypothetical protein R2827_08310 [Bdellovibrionales bacterium]